MPEKASYLSLPAGAMSYIGSFKNHPSRSTSLASEKPPQQFRGIGSIRLPLEGIFASPLIQWKHCLFAHREGSHIGKVRVKYLVPTIQSISLRLPWAEPLSYILLHFSHWIEHFTPVLPPYCMEEQTKIFTDLLTLSSWSSSHLVPNRNEGNKCVGQLGNRCLSLMNFKIRNPNPNPASLKISTFHYVLKSKSTFYLCKSKLM